MVKIKFLAGYAAFPKKPLSKLYRIAQQLAIQVTNWFNNQTFLNKGIHFPVA